MSVQRNGYRTASFVVVVGALTGLGSAELRHDWVAKNSKCSRSDIIKQLRVDPLHGHLYMCAEFVRDLGWRSHQRGVASSDVCGKRLRL
jgi:hypothetical protein